MTDERVAGIDISAEARAEVKGDLHPRAMALIKSFLNDDIAGSLAVVGTDADRLLPIVLGILTGAIERLISHEELLRDVEQWLDRHRDQLAEK